MRKCLVILGLLIFGSFDTLYGDEPPANGAKTSFQTVPLRRGDLAVTFEAQGTLEPVQTADVGTQVSGPIVALSTDRHGKPIDFGAEVDENTVLARIDPKLYLNQVAQAKNAVRRAEAAKKTQEVRVRQADLEVRQWEKQGNAEKLERARLNQALEAGKLNECDVEVLAAQADLQKAEINLGYCAIRSPIKGVIIDRRVNLGQTVVSNLSVSSLFLVASDLRKLQLWATVNEADVGGIHSGHEVTFAVAVFPDRVFKGVVAPNQPRLNAAVHENIVTYTTLINVDNSDRKLLPYMTADIRFQVEEHKNVLLVPNSALFWKPQTKPTGAAKARSAGKGTVWILDDGQPRPVEVELGATDGIQTEIKSSALKPGEPIIVRETAPATGTASQAPKGRRGLPGWPRTSDTDFVVRPGSALGIGVSVGGRVLGALSPWDAEAILRQCPHVLAMAPIFIERMKPIRRGQQAWIPMYLYGTTPGFLTMDGRPDLAQGAPFTERDVRSAHQVCLIGQTVAEKVFGVQSALGRHVTLGDSLRLKVIGVLARKGQSQLALDRDDMVLVPWTVLAHPTRVNQILVRATAAAERAEAEAEVKALLRHRHHVRNAARDDFHTAKLWQ